MRASPLLDAWRNPESDVLIAVEHWCARQPVIDQFVDQPRSPTRVWNYLRRVGPVEVSRKIRSRLSESARDRKVAGLGVGRIIAAPADSSLQPGQRVAFFAPNHSEAWPRLSLDARLVRPISVNGQRRNTTIALPESIQGLAGWSPYSGADLNAHAIGAALEAVTDDSAASTVQETPTTPSLERSRGTARGSGPSAVLFGLGNYAKTLIVPNVRRHLRLAAIHEIDPDQIVAGRSLGAALDTCPWPRDGDRYDAWFIAGYHHTHADLALRALAQDSYAIIEKPIATTHDQLRALTEALAASSTRRLFACFNKRYAEWNTWARADLGVAEGDPVDVHSLVYEIPLPRLHWYNWPNSGTRVVSNGSHWLDYFHYLNGFSPVRDCHVRPLRNTDLTAFVRLDNGAQMTLTLTDTGSDRVGVREMMELRAGRVTVRMIDSAEYQAEDSTQILRKANVNPLHSFRRMYDTICGRIAAGEDGDSLESLRSAALILDLETALKAQQRR